MSHHPTATPGCAPCDTIGCDQCPISMPPATRRLCGYLKGFQEELRAMDRDPDDPNSPYRQEVRIAYAVLLGNLVPLAIQRDGDVVELVSQFLISVARVQGKVHSMSRGEGVIRH